MSNIKIDIKGISHSVTVITECGFVKSVVFDMNIPDAPDELCFKAKVQFEEYFDGRLKKFTLPINIDNLGTPFFRNVLHAIENIPYGNTVSYKDVAISAGTFAVRATGSALKKNPLPIIIPCHRIICSDKRVGHYMGGEGDDIKKFLLRLEGVRLDEDGKSVI